MAAAAPFPSAHVELERSSRRPSAPGSSSRTRPARRWGRRAPRHGQGAGSPRPTSPSPASLTCSRYQGRPQENL